MSVATQDRSAVLRARRGVFIVFATAGLAFASWASRLPDVMRILGLSPGQLGTLLLAMAAGSMVGLPLSGRIIRALGTARTVRFGVLSTALGLMVGSLGADLWHSAAVIWAANFIAGMSIGVWDVAMNHEGAQVEQGLGRAIMPWFHAAYSGATVVSALIGSLLTGLGVPIWAHLWFIAAVVLTAGWYGVSLFFAIPAESDEVAAPRGRSAWLEPRTLLIGLVVLAAAFAEGTANDWVAVAMVEGHGLPAWLGVLGFATFLGFMTLGRIGGTYALDRYGRQAVLWVLSALSIVGSLLVVFGGPVLAFVGAALWGLGASLGFPVGMSAAADDPARAAARLSVVSTIGYLAFLAGPPLLGLLGDHVGVLRALLAVAAFVFPAMLAIPAVREPDNR